MISACSLMALVTEALGACIHHSHVPTVPLSPFYAGHGPRGGDRAVSVLTSSLVLAFLEGQALWADSVELSECYNINTRRSDKDEWGRGSGA